MADRLSVRTLPRVAAAARPLVEPGDLRTGIVHLGLGAFHRAHQAQITEEAVAARGGDWGIAGVTMRSPAVVEQLAPQDGLYTVLTRSSDETSARVVSAVREVMFAGQSAGPVVARLADPAVRITTLTVTEKGYRHDPATGRLRGDDPGIAADVAGGEPRTAVGLLVRGLQARMQADAGPLAVVCCDNLAGNGVLLAGLVRDFVDRLPTPESAQLIEWLAGQVRFPSTMVDRIVPATTPGDRADAALLIGLQDDGPVVTEPFRQWVIEDDFPGGRPAWEHAGALLTTDVTPYETVKLRMLNASHSTLAYLGALDGCETIADAMADEAFATIVDRLMREDVEPTLDPPSGLDLDGYRRDLLARFGNAALRHRTEQVAMDGSQKLPQRLLPTIRVRRAAGAEPRWAAFTLAAWMRWVSSERRDDGTPRALDDPLAPLLGRTVADAVSADDVVSRLLGVTEVFGAELVGDAGLHALLVDALEQISRQGAAAAAKAWAGESSEPQSTPREMP